MEASGDAAISSTDRIVIVGERAWSFRSGEPEQVDASSSLVPIIDALMPHSVAARILAPFAGGYERVGSEDLNGVAAVRYRLTEAGRGAYAQVTGFDGSWTADAWIAEVGGHLLKVEIQAESAAGDDGFFGLASVTDVDDPTIVIIPPE